MIKHRATLLGVLVVVSAGPRLLASVAVGQGYGQTHTPEADRVGSSTETTRGWVWEPKLYGTAGLSLREDALLGVGFRLEQWRRNIPIGISYMVGGGQVLKGYRLENLAIEVATTLLLGSRTGGYGLMGVVLGNHTEMPLRFGGGINIGRLWIEAAVNVGIYATPRLHIGTRLGRSTR